MRPRTSLILAAIAVIVLAGGWYFGPHQAPAAVEHTSAGRLLFPGLSAPLEKAARIDITHHGETLALVRKNDVWTLPALGSYPAEAGKVHALLAGLAGLRLVAKRTADPKQFAALGVGDPSDKSSNANLLRVLDAAGHPIVALIVGTQRFNPGGGGGETVYVRKPDQKQSWLASGALNLDSAISQWVDHSIVNIDHSTITRVAVARGEEHLVFAPKQGKLVLVTPKEHPTLAPDKLDDVWRSLEDLAFSSVASGKTLPGNQLGETAFTLKDGTALTVALATDKKKLWAHFSVRGKTSKAAALEAKLEGWNFLLAHWRESELSPTLADLVQAPATKP